MINDKLKKALGLGASIALVSTLSMGTAFAAPNDDAILMSVNESEYVSETTSPILLSLNPDKPNEPSTIVPGDVLQGSLTVKNNGPDKGILKAYLIDVENNGPDELTMDDWFSGDVQVKANDQSGSLVHWDSSSNGGQASSINGTDYEGIQILEQDIDKNEITDIYLSVEFPESAVSGNSAGYNAKPNGIPNDYSPGKRSSSFDVYLTLEGDTEEEPNPTPEPTPKPTPGPDNPTDNPDEDPTVTPTPNPDGGNHDANNQDNNGDSPVNDNPGNPTDNDGSPVDNDVNPQNNDEVEESTDAPDRITTGADIISSPVGIIGILGLAGIAIGATILFLNRKNIEKT